jgi:hypothetical protein
MIFIAVKINLSSGQEDLPANGRKSARIILRDALKIVRLLKIFGNIRVHSRAKFLFRIHI